MNRTPVSSSNINSVGYDNNGILEVEFNSGSIYRYYSIPPVIYHNLMTAKSHGHYFDEHIKKSRYPYEKVS